MKTTTLIALYLSCFVFCYAQDNSTLNQSNIAFTIPEKDLLPESLAYDTKTGSFFVGSTRKGKVVKVFPDGKIADFIESKQDGLWMIIGMEIDPERRWLWLCSSGGDNLKGYSLKDDTDGRPAGIFKYDLDTGILLKKYTLETKGEVHFFNDIVVTSNGDVYATHMFGEHHIYKVDRNHDRLELLSTTDFIKYPNGITLSGDERSLYIAHSGGIAVMNTKTGEQTPLQVPDGVKITRRESIDGLYFYDNSLIGIQPDINTVIKLSLNANGTQATTAEALEINHPMMNNPTTGQIVNDQFYYIANAQFGSFNEDGTLFPSEKLYEVCVLKLTLK